MTRLAGKVAIVTGSGSGIGRATARRFAAEGARVVVAEIRPDTGAATVTQIEANGGAASFVATDVTQRDQAQRMVQHALATYGRLDILVNNAGGARPQPVESMDEATWDWTVDLCLKAAFLCGQAAIPALAAAGGGAIVNIGSVNGLAASPGLAAYNAAKGGLHLLTMTMALELGRRGIRVNAIAPGHIASHPQLYANDPDALWSFTEGCPIGRVGQPEDIAAVALFLASDDAAFVTGSVLLADGGMMAQVPEVLVASHYRRLYGRRPVREVDAPDR
jgi:NAD(P)-dependent dehydrogenase (short-subunit alcohol dehydrogenase family)